MSAPNGEREYVIRTARENDVKFIRLWFTDILGNLKGFAINICLLYTSPSPRDKRQSRMPSSA